MRRRLRASVGTVRQGRRAARFPDTSLLEVDAAASGVDARTQKLARIYHVAQRQSWDGPAVLADLVDKHGGVHLAPDKREALARVFSIILWGELAAWTVSAELAERIEDIDAKMAATSQVFDEARHFDVMRDYLRLLGCPIPPLDAYSRVVLRELLATESLVYKLVGMQLLVENAALGLFKMVGRARVEPVLSDLLPYFEKDEARHVGLGINYLPTLLAELGPLETLKLNLFQARIYTLLFWDTLLLREDLEVLGLDPNESTRFSLRLQLDIATQMGKFAADARERKAGRGVYVEPELIRRTHSFSIDAFMPRPGAPVPAWQRRLLGAVHGVARAGARAYDVLSPP
jgi:hypothetical protein